MPLPRQYATPTPPTNLLTTGDQGLRKECTPLLLPSASQQHGRVYHRQTQGHDSGIEWALDV
eukprot:11875867-Prorocentrum_lima.AAC.1